jgi:hypothetical protein
MFSSLTEKLNFRSWNYREIISETLAFFVWIFSFFSVNSAAWYIVTVVAPVELLVVNQISRTVLMHKTNLLRKFAVY